MTQEVTKALEEAAKTANVPFQTLKTIAWIESRGDHTARNGSYYGLMQMGQVAVQDILMRWHEAKNKDITWKKVQTDVYTNALAGAYYYKLNTRDLGSKGIEATFLNLYLAHQQGVAGLNKLLSNIKEDPDMLATDAQLGNMSAAYIKKCGGKGSVTQQNFYDYWVSVFNQKKI